jgi:putative DNA primase/helicase
MISAEDAVADTIRPRLEAAGADLRRVSVLEAIEEEEGERSFNLKQDLAVLQNEIEEFGDVVMMVIDPITSYMGENVDSHRTSDVRAVLEPLAAFAERNNIAVLAVSHPPKAAQAKAINAVTGSSAFVAAARIVLMAIQDPHDEDRRLLLHVKNNLSAEAEGLGYRLMQREITNGIIASYVSWDSEPVDVTVGEAMRAAGSSSEAAEGKLDRAMTFLGEQLSGGPTAPDSVMAKAKGLGIGERTLRTAKKKLGVVSRKNGYGAGWMWELPSVA